MLEFCATGCFLEDDIVVSTIIAKVLPWRWIGKNTVVSLGKGIPLLNLRLAVHLLIRYLLLGLELSFSHGFLMALENFANLTSNLRVISVQTRASLVGGLFLHLLRELINDVQIWVFALL